MNFHLFLIVAAVIGSNLFLIVAADIGSTTAQLSAQDFTYCGDLLLTVSGFDGSCRRKRSLEMAQDGRPLDLCHGTIEPGLYVDLKAVNLTGEYNVLLDRCYVSVSSCPSDDGVIIPCDPLCNGDNAIHDGTSQVANCSFPAFRFAEQQDQTVSTYHLHCSTRLRAAAEDDFSLWPTVRMFDWLSNVNSITSPEIRVYRCPKSG